MKTLKGNQTNDVNERHVKSLQNVTPEMYVTQHCLDGVMSLEEFEDEWFKIIDETTENKVILENGEPKLSLTEEASVNGVNVDEAINSPNN